MQLVNHVLLALYQIFCEAIFMHLSRGFIHVSTGLACGLYGNDGSHSIPIAFMYDINSYELNGEQLSDLYRVGRPRFVNILSIASIVTLADVFLSIKTATGYLVQRSCMTNTCSPRGSGPKKSMLTYSQAFDGTYTGTRGSFIALLVYKLQ